MVQYFLKHLQIVKEAINAREPFVVPESRVGGSEHWICYICTIVLHVNGTITSWSTYRLLKEAIIAREAFIARNGSATLEHVQIVTMNLLPRMHHCLACKWFNISWSTLQIVKRGNNRTWTMFIARKQLEVQNNEFSADAQLSCM